MHACTQGTELPDAPDFNEARESLEVDRTVPELDWLQPGTAAGRAQLDDFIQNRLKLFDTSRNDPNVEACSGLSPWFHFGQVSCCYRVQCSCMPSQHKYRCCCCCDDRCYRSHTAVL
jgi:deoxyribodipyrimidine photo-lyase